MINFHGSANTLGLFFFGTMTASMSHEIKNALAIVNEHAGLLDDLAQLAEKGRPLSIERLRTLSADIRRQVQRADSIVIRLNRFAHSARQPVIATDTREVYEFTVALAARLAALKSVEIEVADEPGVPMHIRPFVLENLLWICLKTMLAVSTGQQVVRLLAQEAGADVVLRLQFEEGVQVDEIATQAAQESQPLLVALSAVLAPDAANSRINLTMPKQSAE